MTGRMESGYPERLLLRMLETYSPSGSEGAISRLLAEEMDRLGFRVRVDEVGNVEGKIGPAKSGKILLCGHMDTVEGRIEVRRRGKVVFGRGAVDAKSSLAAMIIAAKRYAEEGGEAEITLLAVVDEEGKSRGMRHYLAANKGLNYDYAIFGEPSGACALTVGYKGRVVLKVTCRTPPGHASAAPLFENSIYVAMRLIDKLRMVEGRLRAACGPIPEIFEVPTFCVTLIRGGMADNTVPSSCEFVVDIRVPPSLAIPDLKREVLSAVEGFRAGEKAEVELSLEDENEPFLADVNSPLVRAFERAVKEVCGKECRLLKKTGTADANDFARLRVPTVVYGPGNSRLDHTPMENISVEEFLKSIEVLVRVLKGVGG